MLQLTSTSCEERDISINEIRQEVSKTLLKGYLLMLYGNTTQNIGNQRRDRSCNRKRTMLNPIPFNLIRRTHSESKKNIGNQFKESNDWGPDKNSAMKKNWKTNYDSHFSRRIFPLININTPVAIKTCMLVNRLQKTLVVENNEVRGANNIAKPSCKYLI